MLETYRSHLLIALVIALVFLGLLPGLAFAGTATVNDLNGISSSSNNPDFAVAVCQGGCLLNTTDGGLTWLWTLPTSMQYRDLYDVGFYRATGTGWAVGARGQIMGSADGGQTWVGEDSTTTQALRSLAVVNDKIAYIAGGGPQPGDPTLDEGVFLRTTNGGVAWEPLTPIDPAQPVGETPLYQYRFTAVGASDTNVWLRGEHAGSQIVALSTDQGTTWRAYPGAATFGSLDLTGPGAAAGFATGGSTILHTTDSWQTVATVQHTAANPLNDIDMFSVTDGWAVGDLGGIVHTTDGGAWVAETSGTTYDLHGVSAFSAAVAWAAGEHGTLLRTTDAGVTWATLPSPPDNRKPRCLATAKASCYRNHFVTLRYRVDDPTSPLVNVKIRIKTKAGRTVKTLGFAQKPANVAATWRFKCTLKKGSYLFWVYATDLSGNVQNHIGKNSLTVK